MTTIHGQSKPGEAMLATGAVCQSIYPCRQRQLDDQALRLCMRTERHQDFIDNPARTSACLNHDGQAFPLNSLSSTCQACTPSSLLLQQSPVCKLLLIYHTCAHTKPARRVKIQVDTHQRWDNLITTGVAAYAIAWPVEAKICQL